MTARGFQEALRMLMRRESPTLPLWTGRPRQRPVLITMPTLLAALGSFVMGGLVWDRGRTTEPPASAAPVASEVRAHRIAVVDRQGRERIAMSASDSGGANLVFYGARDQQARLIVHSYDDGIDGITLYDPRTGRIRLSLGVAPDGTPMELMYDDQNRQKIRLGVFPEGPPPTAIAERSPALLETPVAPAVHEAVTVTTRRGAGR